MSQDSAFVVGGLEIGGEAMNPVNTSIKLETVKDERTVH